MEVDAQHRDFQALARQQVTYTFESMCQELEAIKESQNSSNPMDFSITDNTDLNSECNKVEKEKRKLAEELEKTKTEYEQALASKSCEVSLEIERIKRNMEETNAQRKSRSY